MYTGTIFNWHDNSGFNVDAAVVDTTNRPLFMVVNSFDKGPEKLMEVDATTFNSLFGTMSYERHGQGSIQAQKIIDAGGRLLIKRVCGEDAELANSVLLATITTDNGKGTLKWEIKPIGGADDSGHKPKSYNDVKSFARELYNQQNDSKSYPLFVITDNGRGESIKAVRIIPDYDTSRGLEKMLYKFNIYEGTTLLESANISLDPTYKFNNEYYGLDKNRMTQVTGEVIPEYFEEFVEDVTKLIYPEVDVDSDEFSDKEKIVSGYDLINARTYTDTPIYIDTFEDDEHVALTLDSNSDSLDTIYGNLFKYRGSYGTYGKTPAKFGNEHTVYDFSTTLYPEAKFSDDDDADKSHFIRNPYKSSDWEALNDKCKFSDYEAYRQLVLDIAAVYYGYDSCKKQDIDEVWDVDTHKLFAVVDANYHKWIKDAMANFVQFRKDCIMLRDSGIGFYSVAEAQKVYKYTLSNLYMKSTNFKSFISVYQRSTLTESIISGFTSLRSNFIADYGTNFEVVDPFTKKNVEVTMLYDLAEKLTTLYIDQGPFAPLAGTYNGFILDSAIEGTVNFTPIITPSTNQKQAIDDIRLNYAIFENEDQCVVQSNYTSQDKNTQLSFINNVLSIQEVARVVREVCPRTRFRLITGSDMSEYANAVSRVLQGYSSYFETLEFQYTEDPLRSIQKIFYASINFSFNNWAQTEIFDLYALSNTTTTSNNG